MRIGLFDSDENIIARIKRGDETAWNELDKRIRLGIVSYLISRGASKEDAEDIFHDAIIDFRGKLNRLTLTATIKTYLTAVCKHKWSNELRRRGKHPTIEMTGDEQMVDEPEWTEDQARELTRRQQIAIMCKQELTEKCRNVIGFFYFDNLPIKTIAEKESFANEDSAKAAKSKCMKKLRECVNKKIGKGE